MHKLLLTTTAALALSTGAALAAGTDATAPTVPPANQPLAAVSGYYGYYSGYLFPNDGSPSGGQSMARAVPQPMSPGGVGHFGFSRVYLFSPAEGSDAGNDAG